MFMCYLFFQKYIFLILGLKIHSQINKYIWALKHICKKNNKLPKMNDVLKTKHYQVHTYHNSDERQASVSKQVAEKGSFI